MGLRRRRRLVRRIGHLLLHHRRLVLDLADAVFLLKEEKVGQARHVEHGCGDAAQRVGHLDLQVVDQVLGRHNSRETDLIRQRPDVLLVLAAHGHSDVGTEGIGFFERDVVVGRRVVAGLRRHGEAEVGRLGLLDSRGTVPADERHLRQVLVGLRGLRR